MSLITWDSSYSVNIKEIDAQHKKLIDLVNLLDDKIKEGYGEDVLEIVLYDLIKYSFYHFTFEEAMLAKHSYQALSKHSLCHNEMIEKIKYFDQQFKLGNEHLSIEMLNFLKDWIIKHICWEDKKYSAFLNTKGIQ